MAISSLDLPPLPHRTTPRPNWQPALFCRCGQGTPAIAGLCRVCYRERAHSRARFAGNREVVLERDRRQCQICGAGKAPRRLHVHHRQPGIHDAASLVALCAACHARVHRTLAFRGWLPESLVELWIEQHPSFPLQLQFPLTLPDRPEGAR